MRKSTRQLNKKLLDSLQRKRRISTVFARVFSFDINSKLKEYCVRTVAASLALLMLLSIAITPGTDGIRSIASDTDIITIPDPVATPTSLTVPPVLWYTYFIITERR